MNATPVLVSVYGCLRSGVWVFTVWDVFVNGEEAAKNHRHVSYLAEATQCIKKVSFLTCMCLPATKKIGAWLYKLGNPKVNDPISMNTKGKRRQISFMHFPVTRGSLSTLSS